MSLCIIKLSFRVLKTKYLPSYLPDLSSLYIVVRYHVVQRKCFTKPHNTDEPVKTCYVLLKLGEFIRVWHIFNRNPLVSSNRHDEFEKAGAISHVLYVTKNRHLHGLLNCYGMIRVSLPEPVLMEDFMIYRRLPIKPVQVGSPESCCIYKFINSFGSGFSATVRTSEIAPAFSNLSWRILLTDWFVFTISHTPLKKLVLEVRDKFWSLHLRVLWPVRFCEAPSPDGMTTNCDIWHI